VPGEGTSSLKSGEGLSSQKPHTSKTGLCGPPASRFPYELRPCVHRVCDRAGLQPTSRVAAFWMLPSACGQGVGVPEQGVSRLHLLARTFPCQRFGSALASGSA
jgi:hypothetical protein